VKQYERLAVFLDENARCPEDNEAAAMLRKLGRVHQVAYEMVWAKTHEHSKNAYVEMIDLIKGKADV
jgi:hypothetical protein